ncbi:S-adenosyl-L-methionine-dependent methyltransferase [Zopfochytrium polystomum]|nr:S-adenosyl-L-methionine-dependent methyltransferase [Zopfochytrium polystomum]
MAATKIGDGFQHLLTDARKLTRSQQSRSTLRILFLVVTLLAVLGLSALLLRQATRNDNRRPFAEGRPAVHDDQTRAIAPSSYALPAASTPAEHQAQARFAQSFYCARFYPLPPSTTTLRYVPLKIDGFHPDKSRRPAVTGGVGMYVVGGDQDIVSNSIAGSGSWESDISSGVLQALAEAESVGVQDPLFLDIGSNLGMHSVAVLAYGYRVMSIDALTLNAHHFMSTLCMHPQLMEKSTFVLNGLGSTSTTCAISSDDFNLGDGTVTCNPSEIARYRTDTHPLGLKPFRQWLQIDPLDTFLDEDVWAVKMDVEGFELDVLRGARRLFTRRRVHYLLTEIMGGEKKSKEMVVVLKQYGFSCSEEGWYGKRWAIPETAEMVTLKGGIYNIWCIHPDNLRHAGLEEKVGKALLNV